LSVQSVTADQKNGTDRQVRAKNSADRSLTTIGDPEMNVNAVDGERREALGSVRVA